MKNIIKINNLYKEYKIGKVGSGTLYRDLQSLSAKLRGKEDPNSLLGINTSNNKIKSFFALENLNLEIERGSVVGIVGRNGAGKSTLLKIISKITSPTKGTIDIYGKVASLLEVGTGFHPELTGEENIYLNGSINGMTIREVKKSFDSIVDFAGIDKLLRTPVKRYSSGMIVRLGFSVAAHLNSEILIIDEVLSVGDVHFRKKAEKKLEEKISKEGKTILYVSHNMESIKKLCNKAALLDKGQLKLFSNVDDVLKKYLSNSQELIFKNRIHLKQHSEEKIQILEFFITDDQNEAGYEFDRTKSFKINIIYKINDLIENNFVGFNIHTNTNHNNIQPDTPVMQWSERHYKKLKMDNNDIIKKNGIYHVKIDIPGYILTQGQYYLTVYIKNLYNFVDTPKEKLFFKLYDYDSSHNFTEGISAGLIAMPLNWDENIIKNEI